jgi:hypothetical protein
MDWPGKVGAACACTHTRRSELNPLTGRRAELSTRKSDCQARCGHLACKSMSRPAHTTCLVASTAGRRVETAAIWFWFSGHYRALPGTSSACLVFAVKWMCRCNGWLVDGQAGLGKAQSRRRTYVGSKTETSFLSCDAYACTRTNHITCMHALEKKASGGKKEAGSWYTRVCLLVRLTASVPYSIDRVASWTRTASKLEASATRT